ncbi:MAG: branched-chain amino acid ABC transporter permease [Pseudomonadota bacterium]|nr:branched-chain amino acid ABC transporter permease [Pseudomonadota bacterium]
MSGYWGGILGILCINIIFAYSIFLPAASGQLNLGGAGFMAIGAYTAAFLNTGLEMPMWITIPGAALFTAAISFVIAFPILRTRGVYMVLATFAFAEVVAGIIINMDVVGGASGYEVPSYAELGLLSVFAIGTIVFVFYLLATRFGLSMRAVHDDENVAALFGVKVRFTQVMTFTIGGALAGIAGALYAHQYNYIEIQYFNILISIFVLLYILIGGTQTAWGPLFGAILFTFLPEFLRLPEMAGMANGGVLAEWRFVIFGTFLVAVMVFRPEGLITRALVDRLRHGHVPDDAAGETG